MKKNLFQYILMSLCLLLASCSDDLHEGSVTNGFSNDGNLNLSVMTDFTDLRTRDVDMSPNAYLMINKIWVGVFDKSNGNLVHSVEKYLNYRSTSAGSEMQNVIDIEVDSWSSQPDEVIIVCAANYDGGTENDEHGTILTSDSSYDCLKEALESISTWNEFIELNLDVKNSTFNDNAPIMLGYLVDKNSNTSTYAKVDQFAAGSAVNLSDAGDDITISKNNGSYNFFNKIIKLRRLVAQVNVNIIPDPEKPGLSITDLSYRRVNMPASVFMAERTTDDSNSGKSPNYADKNPSEYYFSEGEDSWQQVSGVNGFSFQHYENKHWSKQNITSFSDRESKNKNGAFTALAENPTDANNYASYFVLKMRINDMSTGQNADVEYVVHEGYCNKPDGSMQEGGNANDFMTVRNTNYTYNILISGVNDIVTQVTADNGSGDYQHIVGQKGTVYQMIYADKENRQIETTEETKLFPDCFSFTEGADLAFRLLSTDSNDEPYDICYNFHTSDYPGYKGLWPDAQPYTQFPSDLDELENNTLTTSEMLQTIKIWDGSQAYDIVDFILNKKFEAGKSYGLLVKGWAYKFNDDPRNHLRALYIFDKRTFQEGGIEMDEDGCSSLYKIYAAEQYPYDPRKIIRFDISDMVFHDEYYRTLDNDMGHWCGGKDLASEIIWRHKEGISNYKVEVYQILDGVESKKPENVEIQIDGSQVKIISINGNNAEFKNEITTTINDTRFFKEYKGEKIIICPFPVGRYSKLDNYQYNVKITPTLGNPDDYKNDLTPVFIDNGLIIKEDLDNNYVYWDFGKAPWNQLGSADFPNPKPLEYNGLVLNHETPRNHNDGNFQGGYIQLQGEGDINKDYFCIYVNEPGELIITASGTNSDRGRYIQVYKEGDSTPIDSQEIVNGTNRADFKFNITTNGPTRYYVIGTANCRYYKMSYKRGR